MNGEKYYLIANEFEVLDIITLSEDLPFDELRNKLIGLNNYQVFKINNLDSKYSKGYKLKIEPEYGLIPIIQMTLNKYNRKRTPYSEYLIHKENILIPELKNFLSNFSVDTMNVALQKVKELKLGEEEISYRVMYNSFKMYRLRENSFILAKVLISLVDKNFVDCENLEELSINFKKQNFDVNLNLALDQMIVCLFNLERNETNNWFEDAIKLWGSYQLLLKATEFIIGFIQELKDQTTFLHENRNIINWIEAGAMETWSPLSLLRNANSEDSKIYLDLIKVMD